MKAFKKENGVVVSLKAKTKAGKRLIMEYGPIVRKMNSIGDEVRMQHPFLDDPTANVFFSYWVKFKDIDWVEIKTGDL